MIYEFHPAAEAEFLESVGFYESRAQGLGEDLSLNSKRSFVSFATRRGKGQWNVRQTSAAPRYNAFLSPSFTEKNSQKFKYLPLHMSAEDLSTGLAGFNKNHRHAPLTATGCLCCRGGCNR